MKKNILVKLAALISTAALLTACGSSPESPQSSETTTSSSEGGVLAKIKDSGVLTIGTEAQYAPYEFKDADANFAGADIALAQRIADDMGVELKVVDMKFDGIIPAVQSGQVDLGIAAFSTTPERAKVIDFSEPYEESTQMLVVAADKAGEYTSVEALSGLKVGAQKGTIQAALVKSELTGSQLFELDKYPALALEVQNGNIAGLVADEAVGQGIIDSSDGKLAAANFTFTSEEANVGKAIVMAKGNEDLKAEVDKSVTAMKNDGSWDKAYEEAVKLAASLGLK